MKYAPCCKYNQLCADIYQCLAFILRISAENARDMMEMYVEQADVHSTIITLLADNTRIKFAYAINTDIVHVSSIMDKLDFVIRSVGNQLYVETDKVLTPAFVTQVKWYVLPVTLSGAKQLDAKSRERLRKYHSRTLMSCGMDLRTGEYRAPLGRHFVDYVTGVNTGSRYGDSGAEILTENPFENLIATGAIRYIDNPAAGACGHHVLQQKLGIRLGISKRFTGVNNGLDSAVGVSYSNMWFEDALGHSYICTRHGTSDSSSGFTTKWV
jgi:hypothetical protein